MQRSQSAGTAMRDGRARRGQRRHVGLGGGGEEARGSWRAWRAPQRALTLHRAANLKRHAASQVSLG